jgi:hypothetical protein
MLVVVPEMLTRGEQLGLELEYVLDPQDPESSYTLFGPTNNALDAEMGEFAGKSLQRVMSYTSSTQGAAQS